VTAASPWRSGLLVAIVWLAAVVLYLLVFYAAPLSLSAGGRPVARASFLLLAFTPELYWETWTAEGAMRLALWDRAPIALVTAFLLALAVALGWAVLELAGIKRLSKLEVLVFSAGVGLNLLSLITLVVGLTGWTAPTLMWVAPSAVLTGALCALAVWRRRRVRPSAENFVVASDSQDSSWPWLTLGTPFVLVIVLGAMLPPSDFDVREYHLQVPKEWFLEGSIGFMPHNVYGNMPLGAEILSLPAMALMPGERSWWWGALAGKTLIACYAVLTSLALFAAGRRFFTPLAGAVAALVYISIPWIAHTAMAGLNDHVLACYVFLSFYALLLWRSEPASPQLLGLAGFLAGAAAACKYTGMLFAVAPLGALTIFLSIRSNRPAPDSAAEARPHRLPRPVFSACVFALSAALACFPWYAKNWALAGNPVYPLMYDVFNGETLTPEKAAQWRRAHQVPRSEDNGAYSLRRLGAAAGQVAYRSDWLSPILVPLLLLTPLQQRRRKTLALTAAMMLFLLAAWWLFTHRIDRFWVPALPLAALLAGAGAAWNSENGWRRLILGVVVAGLLANFLVAAIAVGDARFLVALEDLRTDLGDLPNGIPGRVKPAHHFLNQTVPPEGAVLLVGDAQPFDLEARVYYNTCFDDNLFEQLTKGHSPDERRREFEKRGITHVYVSWNEIARYRSPGNYGFTDYVQPERFDELVADGLLREIWSEQPVEMGVDYPPSRVYEVVATRAAEGR
jgi:hypothetical protein